MLGMEEFAFSDSYGDEDMYDDFSASSPSNNYFIRKSAQMFKGQNSGPIIKLNNCQRTSFMISSNSLDFNSGQLPSEYV